MAWRRSYDASPPPLNAAAEHSQLGDSRYEMLPPEARPRAESLREVSARLLPYWYDAIVPDLLAGGCVLVVSHAQYALALVKHLDSIRLRDRRPGHPHRHPAGLRARAGPAPGRFGRRVPRPARRPGRDRSHQGHPGALGEDHMNSTPNEQAPRIVVGVDGFESSTDALRWAIIKAKLTGAVVEAVTAWHIPAGLAGPGDRYARLPGRRPDGPHRGDHRDVHDRYRRRGPPARGGGRAAQVLVDLAEGAELLVVGCRGTAGSPRPCSDRSVSTAYITRRAPSSSCAVSTDSRPAPPTSMTGCHVLPEF